MATMTTITEFATETLLARQLNPWETIPTDLRTPFPTINPEWIWVVDSPDGICAILYGGDLHGVAYLARLATRNAPRIALVILFRRMLADLKERGYKQIMCWLSATQKAELKLARIMQRLGGALSAESGYFAMARIDGRKW